MFILLQVIFSGVAGAYTVGSGVVWKPQVSGTTHDLNAVDFIDAETGWAVGEAGTIVRTEDGVTWTAQNSGTSVDLYDVCFTSAFVGWVVGADGTVLGTGDGGANWTSRSPDTYQKIHGVHFVDERTGWVVGWGGEVFSTRDGGTTWSRILLGRYDMLDFFLYGVHFVDKDTGWIVGKLGYIFGTTDGGVTWTTQLEGDGGPPLLRLAFADAEHGWAVGGFDGTWSMERIYHTIDGGRTWTLQYEKAATRFGDISCLDRNVAWVVDWFDDVLYTTDGGETWEKQPLKGAFRGVDFVNGTTGWAVGREGVIVKAVPNVLVTPTLRDTVSSPYMMAMELLLDAGIAAGYDDGTFRPDNPLLRAQFAKMICLALKLPVDESMEPPFTDMGPDYLGTLYHHEYIAAAAANGIVNGTHPGIFDPWDDVTRAQVLTMVVRALKKLEPQRLATPPVDFRGSYAPLDPTHGSNLRVAEYNHLLDGLVGIGKGWNPWAKMTRGEIAQVLWNAREATGPAR